MLHDFGKEIAKINQAFKIGKKNENLSISEVARRAKCSRDTVYSVLAGGRKRPGGRVFPTLDSVLAVADALGLRLRVSRRTVG
jgi:DNA-binding phage protein